MTLLDRTALEARWLDLTRRALPALAAGRRWPVRFDHCFQRILLDAACGGRWMDHVAGRPAYKAIDGEKLAAAVDLAERVGLDMSAWWSATPDTFLSQVPKALVLEVVAEVAGKDTAKALETAKRDAVTVEAAKHLAGTNWLPKPLRGPTYKLVKKGAKPAAAAAPAKAATSTKPAKAGKPATATKTAKPAKKAVTKKPAKAATKSSATRARKA